MNENSELLVLEVSEQWPSKVTQGMCVTIKFKDLATNQWWTVWPDTTWKFQFDQWMQIAKPGNVVKGAQVYNEKKRRINSRYVPTFVRRLDFKSMEEHKPTKKSNEPLPGQVPLV